MHIFSLNPHSNSKRGRVIPFQWGKLRLFERSGNLFKARQVLPSSWNVDIIHDRWRTSFRVKALPEGNWHSVPYSVSLFNHNCLKIFFRPLTQRLIAWVQSYVYRIRRIGTFFVIALHKTVDSLMQYLFLITFFAA